MNELKELDLQRKAVTNTFNDLYDDIKAEVYEDTIKELNEHIQRLEKDLDMLRQLYNDEVINKNFYKQGFDFMKKVKTITVRD